MTYDLVDQSGEVLFSGYPYADALAEQKWRIMTNQSSVAIVPHGKAREHCQPPRPPSSPPDDLV